MIQSLQTWYGMTLVYTRSGLDLGLKCCQRSRSQNHTVQKFVEDDPVADMGTSFAPLSRANRLVTRRLSMAFNRVSLCVCVCLSARQNQNGRNYNHLTCHRDSPSRVLAHQLILGQKVKGQGYRVTELQKHTERFSYKVA